MYSGDKKYSSISYLSSGHLALGRFSPFDIELYEVEPIRLIRTLSQAHPGQINKMGDFN
jgi:hypothetical protein